MQIERGIPSPATMLFNRPIRGLLPQMNIDPINVVNDDIHDKALETHQRKNYKCKDYSSSAVGKHRIVDTWCDNQPQ